MLTLTIAHKESLQKYGPFIALVVCAADKRDGPYMETTVQLTLAVVLTPVVKPPQ